MITDGPAMLSAASGLPWQVYAGWGIGLVLLCTSMWTLLWYERRRRTLVRARPPQESKLLRPPGHSLVQRIEDLNDRLYAPMAELTGGAVCVGVISVAFVPLARFMWSKPDALDDLLSARGGQIVMGLLFGLVAAALVGLHGLLRLQKLFRQVRYCRLGLRGEQAVAEVLNSRKVRSAGYVVFHDVPTDGPGNVDHVAVGPGGVFVIETKTRSKRKATKPQPEAEVRFDGKALQFPWGDDLRAARQVELNAAWVRRFIGEFADKGILIQPVLVLPGWYVTSLGNYAVKAMNAKYLEDYLSRIARTYSAEQIEPIISRLDERCRTLEF